MLKIIKAMQTNKMTCPSNKGLEMSGRPCSLADPEKGGGWVRGILTFFFGHEHVSQRVVRTSLEKQFNWFLREVHTRISKVTYSHL